MAPWTGFSIEPSHPELRRFQLCRTLAAHSRLLTGATPDIFLHVCELGAGASFDEEITAIGPPAGI